MNTERDIYNQMQFAENKGLAKGREEGREEEKLDIARKMRILGVDVSIIIESTGLSKEQVEAL